MYANCTAWHSRTVVAPAVTHSAGQPAAHGFCAPSLPDARCVLKTSTGPSGCAIRARGDVPEVDVEAARSRRDHGIAAQDDRLVVDAEVVRTNDTRR